MYGVRTGEDSVIPEYYSNIYVIIHAGYARNQLLRNSRDVTML